MTKLTRLALVLSAFSLVGAGYARAVPYGEFLKAPTLPVMYGKQAVVKTPQKVFRLDKFDVRDSTYPVVQVSIGGERLDLLLMLPPPYLADEEGGKGPGAFMPIYFAFRNNGPGPVTFDLDTSTWKLVTVGADKLLYVNPLVKLASVSKSGFRDVNILWEASPKDYTCPVIATDIQTGSAITLANYDISHALKVARDTTQGRTLPQMFLVIGDAVAYEIPLYVLPQSGPDKAAVDRIVESVEKAMGERE